MTTTTSHRPQPSRDVAAHWTLHAKCQGSGDSLFVDGGNQKQASLFCSGCPVRVDCLAEALDNKIEWGVWGGLTERERRSLLRRRSDVISWRNALAGE
ncbi:MAG: WhiB family transcriptional regulator [Propionibacteriales bacterium]|nr:WhiB family transcriptional regulator [Propionibacteriales bacterium]